jgi:alpha-mannosidase
MGQHQFRYGVYPHTTGDILNGEVIKMANIFNTEVEMLDIFSDQLLEDLSYNSSFTNFPGLFSLDPDGRGGLLIDTIKLSEDNLNDIILRCVESSGSRGVAIVLTCLQLESVLECDLMENELSIKEFSYCATKKKNCVKLNFAPFKLLTLRFKIKQ